MEVAMKGVGGDRGETSGKKEKENRRGSIKVDTILHTTTLSSSSDVTSDFNQLTFYSPSLTQDRESLIYDYSGQKWNHD